MSKYKIKYTVTVVVDAEDIDEAECLAVDIEGHIEASHRRIVHVDLDPYLEKL